ncbi:hypothetical protein FSHL1_004865 [Fusarium sambucinum]
MQKMSIVGGGGKASSHSLLSQTQDVPNETLVRDASVWPNHPKTLDYGWKALWLLPLVVIWLPFIGKHPLEPISAHGDAVLEAIGLASTLWPIALAAIIGALVRTVALFRAEQGTDLGTLATLLGSQTLIGTIKTAFVLRILSLWTLVLSVLWTFSPLGGQAVLRTIQITPQPSSHKQKVSYVPAADIGLPFNYRTWTSLSVKGGLLGMIQSMFGAALSAPNALAQASNGSSANFEAVIQKLGGVGIAVGNAKVDLWGNVRVPEITQLPNYDSSDPYKWIEAPSDQLVTYESLIGIPIRGIPPSSAGNFTLEVSATYMALKCSSWFDTQEWFARIPYGLRMHRNMNTSITEEIEEMLEGGTSQTYMDIPRHIGFFNFSAEDKYSAGKVERATLVFGTSENSTVCDISHIYVDVGINCERPRAFETMACHAQRVRHSLGYGISVPDTQLIEGNGTAPGYFIAGLPWLAKSFHPRILSPFESYIADPALGIGEAKTGYDYVDITTEYTKLPLKVFAQRLSLVINTAMRVSYCAPAVLASGKMSTAEMDVYLGRGVIKYTNTTGEFTTSELRYQVQKKWMTIYIFSLVLMGVSILATVALNLATRAPDFLTNISALTRDSIYINVPQGGSTHCGDDRARLLKNRRLKIRDVQSEEDIGYVTLADDPSHGNQRGFKVAKKRLYV